jgi:hypothetical protein
MLKNNNQLLSMCSTLMKNKETNTLIKSLMNSIMPQNEVPNLPDSEEDVLETLVTKKKKKKKKKKILSDDDTIFDFSIVTKQPEVIYEITTDSNCTGTYCVMLVNKLFFEKMGGIKLNCSMNIYIANRTFIENSPSNEVSSIIGVSIEHVNEIDKLISILQKSKVLADIAGINELYFYRRVAFGHLKANISSIESNMLMLFTVEPRGTGELEKIYPRANLCLPGGSMDACDGNDPSKCMMREINEELHINLSRKMFDVITRTVYQFKYSKIGKYKQCYILDMEDFYFF